MRGPISKHSGASEDFTSAQVPPPLIPRGCTISEFIFSSTHCRVLQPGLSE